MGLIELDNWLLERTDDVLLWFWNTFEVRAWPLTKTFWMAGASVGALGAMVGGDVVLGLAMLAFTALLVTFCDWVMRHRSIRQQNEANIERRYLMGWRLLRHVALVLAVLPPWDRLGLVALGLIWISNHLDMGLQSEEPPQKKRVLVVQGAGA